VTENPSGPEFWDR